MFWVLILQKLKKSLIMKFTKEDAYKDLVSKMTARGEKLDLSERSINEQLDTLMPMVANDETELSDFVEKTLPLFKTANANIRNDVSVGINKYKTEHPIADPKPTASPTEGKEGSKSEFEKRIEALELELATAKREKQMTDIRKSIIGKLKDKGVKNEEWVNSLLSEVSITDDFDVDAKVESYLNLYNKSQAQTTRNATPEGATGGKGDNYVKDIIKQASELAKSQRFGGD